MANTTSLDSDTPARGEASNSGNDASKAEGKMKGVPATKPRRRAPAKPAKNRAKSSTTSDEPPSSGRVERADLPAREASGPATATDPVAATTVVDASALLERVVELTSLAERQRVRLKEDEAERNRLQAELRNERQRRETAESRLGDLEDRYSEVAAELTSEGEAREQAELDLDRAEANFALLEQHVRLSWSRLRASEHAQDSKWRWWRPRT
jgi:hypothetical protein